MLFFVLRIQSRFGHAKLQTNPACRALEKAGLLTGKEVTWWDGREWRLGRHFSSVPYP
jgi:hypothetical protein